jgi:hypothetical protein
MDELYGELDEVSSAAVKRHIAGCTHCAALLRGLRATRSVAVVPLVAPPADLERRVLLAAGADLAVAPPVHDHLARAVSAAGSWAMRPQTAMAAVFLVMLGASVLLLRGRSSRAPASAEMIVTEKGTPAPAPSSGSQGQTDMAGASPTAVAGARALGQKASGAPPAGAPADLASGAAREKASAKVASSPKPEESPIAFRAEPAGNLGGAPAPAAPAALAAPAGRSAARASRDSESLDTAAQAPLSPGLVAARALRDSQGCRAAVPRFDEVAQHAAGSSAGWEALLESARCYRSLGDDANARARLATLLGVAQFKDRARAELDLLDQAAASQPQP